MLGLLVAGARIEAHKPLSLSVTGPANRDVITGSLNYVIKVTNLSAAPISDVRVTDILPAIGADSERHEFLRPLRPDLRPLEATWFSFSTGSTVRILRA